MINRSAAERWLAAREIDTRIVLQLPISAFPISSMISGR
jgi:hypothetical protein